MKIFINWPTAIVLLSVLTLIGSVTIWAMSLHYNDKHWTILYKELAKGCVQPGNRQASISILLNHNQAWSCTPIVKGR